MFDVLVRMLDEQGTEVLPSEFMAAAERNDLMKNIDRWVIGASMSFCASRKPSCMFVRLSKDSVRRQVAARLAADPAQGDTHRAAAHRVPGQRGGRDAVSRPDHAIWRRPAPLRLPLRARAFRHRPRSARAARQPAGGLHQGRRHADAGTRRSTRSCSSGERPGRPGEGQEGRDDRRARRGRQHHGGAVAARHRVHPGLLRQRARSGRDRAAR